MVKRNFCVGCGVYLKPKINGVILLKEREYLHHADLYECPKCGYQLLPADCLGDAMFYFDRPDYFKVIEFESDSHRTTYRVGELNFEAFDDLFDYLIENDFGERLCEYCEERIPDEPMRDESRD